ASIVSARWARCWWCRMSATTRSGNRGLAPHACARPAMQPSLSRWPLRVSRRGTDPCDILPTTTDVTPARRQRCLQRSTPRSRGLHVPTVFFVLRALYTMSGRAPVRHRPGGDKVGDHISARPLAHLAIIGPGLLVQIRPTRPPPLGSLSYLCSLGPAGHGSGGRGGPAAG